MSKLLLIFFAALSVVLVVIILLNSIFDNIYVHPAQVKFGVTFSPTYAQYLNLDWQKTYTKVLDDLKVRNLRIPSYWDIVQTQPQQYNFSEIDYLLNEAQKRGAKVILVLGARQPRWPECHIPTWAKSLQVSQRQQKTLEYIQKVVERYKNNSVIWAFQVENEPLLGVFGEGCDRPDSNFLKQEAVLVKSLSRKTIIMTDSGELGFWVSSMQLSDIFGTTLYRQVYDKSLGYITYPLPAYLYNIKSKIVRNIFARNNQKTIIAELQSEPWMTAGKLLGPDQQAKLFTPQNFQDYINYAKKTGFDEVYLWGAEWWYFMAEHGQPQYLEYAKTLFR